MLISRRLKELQATQYHTVSYCTYSSILEVLHYPICKDSLIVFNLIWWHSQRMPNVSHANESIHSLPQWKELIINGEHSSFTPPIYSAVSPTPVYLWDSGVYLRPGRPLSLLCLSDCAEQAQPAHLEMHLHYLWGDHRNPCSYVFSRFPSNEFAIMSAVF